RGESSACKREHDCGYDGSMTEGQAQGETESAKLHAELGGLLLFTQQLNNVEGVDYWIVQVPLGILHEIWRTHVQLSLAIQQENIPKLAFLCRSALELHIWARYIISTPDAAKRFHQDAYVDALEILKLMDKAFKHTPSEVHSVIKTQLDPLVPQLESVLVRDKVGASIAQLQNMKHLYVGEIARDVGYAAVYELWNPMLSKLVHATAYSVLVAGNDMNNIGLNLVTRTAEELRYAVANVDDYLATTNLPRYMRRCKM
ncbi:MAG TPA: DUF5677 domain-containing protein, partial [Bryobacteraceae bacterium]|nr:DUF5677 domain-containing protein [Bryobacteraceae bacterium]